MEDAYARSVSEVLDFFGVDPAKGLSDSQVDHHSRMFGRNGMFLLFTSLALPCLVFLDCPAQSPCLHYLAMCSSLCNDSVLQYNPDKDSYEKIGESTEVALRVLAEKVGLPGFDSMPSALNMLSKHERASYCNHYWENQFKKVYVLEFTRDRKMMSVLCSHKQMDVMFSKGAPESIIARCTKLLCNSDGSVVPLTAASRAELESRFTSFGDETLRCLALAFKTVPHGQQTISYDNENDLTFIGLVGMLDPPRKEVRDAMLACMTAGIRVIVVTGDNKSTAESICRKIGAFDNLADFSGLSYTASEFERLPAMQQTTALQRMTLFSRVEPSHKRMLVEALQNQNEVVAMTGDGVNDAPALKKADIGIAMGSGTAVAKLDCPAQSPCLHYLAMCSSLCNDSVLQYNPDKDSYEKIGESTEVALRVLAEKVGLPGFDSMPSALNMLSKHERASYCNHYWENQFKKVYVLEFTRDRKMMSVLCSHKQMDVMFSKGAPESIIARCTKLLCNSDGSVVPLTAASRAELESRFASFGDETLRCLALAFRTVPHGQQTISYDNENDLTFIGLVGMLDPPRKEVRDAMLACMTAGIRVIVVTGDNKRLKTHKFPSLLLSAPALKKADIGIAMGSGTAVAKSASDMVLADDNFASIVAAVAEGRAIYNNTKQFIRYMISSNIGEVVCIFVAAVLGIPDTLAPVQLLWVNLVTDGLPATAIGFNKQDSDVMKAKPRKVGEAVVTGWLFFRYLVIGVYVGLATVAGFIWWFIYSDGGPKLTYSELMNFETCALRETSYPCSIFEDRHPSTVAMTVLVVVEMFNALNNLSENQSLLVITPRSNLWLVGSIILTMVLHMLILYVHPLAVLFSVTPLSWGEWTAVLYLSFPVIIIDEVLKFLSRNTGLRFRFRLRKMDLLPKDRRDR
ncbi:hypothetical protein DY000_02057973 [Brassica cretica]|uniref:Cation-transporting P-type ATPase C-terminal domain-containing protein n=1 Tax=Brassica cretica TaxID=69181 RepID=A0ABQ7AJQ1_BRACR|nr:hypothetical protein DY000_02057973 [Brassica cretica]